MKRLVTLVLAPCLLAGAALVAARPAPAKEGAAEPSKKIEKYKVGDVLKDAKLTDFEGKEMSLLKLTKGQVAIVNFFGRH